MLARWTEGLVADLNSGFPGVTGATEALQIAQRIGKFGVSFDGLNVIDLKPPPFAALDALPAVTVQRLHPQSLPARPLAHFGAVALVFVAQAAHAITCMS